MALGHYGAQMRKLKRSYAERRSVMSTALQKHGLVDSAAAKFGGTSFWITGPDTLNSDELATALASKGVLIDTGTSFFGRSDAPSNCFRIAYSSIDSSKIEAGIALIAETIAELS